MAVALVPGAAFAGPPTGFHTAPPSKSVAAPGERNVDNRCIFVSGCHSHERHRRELDGQAGVERIDVPLADLREAITTVLPKGTIRELRRSGGGAASDVDPAHRTEARAFEFAALHAGLNLPLEAENGSFSVVAVTEDVDERWQSPFRFEAFSKGPNGRMTVDILEGMGDENHPLRVRTWTHGESTALRSGLTALLRRSPDGRRWVTIEGYAYAELPMDLAPLGELIQANTSQGFLRDGLDRTEVFGQSVFHGDTVVDVHALSGDPRPLIRVRVRN